MGWPNNLKKNKKLRPTFNVPSPRATTKLLTGDQNTKTMLLQEWKNLKRPRRSWLSSSKMPKNKLKMPLASSPALKSPRLVSPLNSKTFKFAFERQTVQLANADKKQRNFDKDMAAQVSKYEEVNAELEAAQKDFRDLSADQYKLKQSYDESQDAYAALKKEWKNLKDENGELADQLTTGGKSLYEVGKAKKKAEADYEEMKSALEEAEGALELEESRVLRLQLELAAAKADVELQYDVLSKNFADAGKNYKKLQASYKDLQDESDAAGVAYSELKDQFSANERKYGLLFADYEEIKGTLDANDRTRKAAADELANLTDAYQTLTAQNAALSSAKRKLESEHEVLHNEWEDATAAAKSAEDAAKKALA